MGMDMVCKIKDKDGNALTDNLVDFRNSEYFAEVRGNGNRAEYVIFHDILKYIPELFQGEDGDIFEDERTGNTGFGAMTVGEFECWYDRYKPWERAGYVPRYKAWVYINKGIAPYDSEVIYFPTKEDIEENDFVFLKYDKDDFMSEVKYKLVSLRNEYVKKNIDRIENGEITRSEVQEEFNDNHYVCIYFNW